MTECKFKSRSWFETCKKMWKFKMVY